MCRDTLVYVRALLLMATKKLWAQGTGLCFQDENTHLFSFRTEGGCVPSAHTLPCLPALFCLEPFGLWEYGSALGHATLALDSLDSLFFQPLCLRRTTPHAKEGRVGRKEVRAELTTKQGGFATFLVENSAFGGEKVEPRKVADFAHPGLGVK